MYRSILSLSKIAHQMWRDYPFSQTKMATERAVGVGGRRWQGSGVGGGVDKIWKGGVGGWQYRRGGLHKITGLASSANNEKKDFKNFPFLPNPAFLQFYEKSPPPPITTIFGKFHPFCSIYLVYKIEIFHQLMRDLGYVLKINPHYFELTVQKDTKYAEWELTEQTETKYAGWNLSILNFQLCHILVRDTKIRVITVLWNGSINTWELLNNITRPIWSFVALLFSDFILCHL